MKADSSRQPSDGNAPRKPRADFPLNIHKGTGYWCKKIRGHVYYFGKFADDPEGKAALEQYERERDDLEAGREPGEKPEGELTVKNLCDQFLNAKETERDNGELSPRSFWAYYATCAEIVSTFGRGRLVVDLKPVDFRKLREEFQKGAKPQKKAPTQKGKKRARQPRDLVALGNAIVRARSVFKFAYDEGRIPKPVSFGQGFRKPKKENIDRKREAHRIEHGERFFEAHEIRQLLDACGQPLKTMILLAINGGLGQSDLSALSVKAIDLEKGWLIYPRVKTVAPRRIPLWPETVAAIREWLPLRPAPRTDAKVQNPAASHLLFITQRGGEWVKLNATGSPSDAIGDAFDKIQNKLGIKRSRRGFYALRHSFETVAGETLDQICVDALMGHQIKGMASHYIERINDDRRQRVTGHVRSWLFGQEQKGGAQ